MIPNILGAFVGKSLLASEELSMTANEWITFGVILMIFLVGTFASQLVSSVWKEVQEELKSIQQQQESTVSSSSSSDKNSLDLLAAFGIEKQDVPSPLIQWNEKLSAAWKRLKLVIEDEV